MAERNSNGTGANLFRASLAFLQALIVGILFYVIGRIDKLDDNVSRINARLATIEWRIDHEVAQ